MLTLPATRLLIPARPAPERLLQRSRLLDLLTQRQRKLMLLVAPAGFGKTTLALDYIAASNRWHPGQAAAWLSLDLGGIVKWDTRIFVQALSLALKNALPSLDLKEVEAELADVPSEGELSEEVAAGLIFGISNALAAQPRPVLLTIDDYHLVCDERSVRDAGLINDIVNALLVTSPPQLRLLISSRAYPTLDVLKLSMDDELLVMNKAQLKFTRDEIGAFLNLRGKDAALTDQIVQESEGWAAAVALKLQNLDLEAHIKDQNFGGALVASSRYSNLAEEMLKQLARPLRRLLEACSALDFGINAPIAGQLIACYEAIEAPILETRVAEQLRRLEEIGLLERHNNLTETGQVYRLHSLLKEYLESNLTAETNQALNNAACHYYREIGDWALAFEHALKAQDHTLAAEILEERAFEQFKNSSITDLEDRVKRLYDTALASHPHLLQVAGMVSHMVGNVDKALAYYHAANKQWGQYEPLDRLIYNEQLKIAPLAERIALPPTMELFRLFNKAETLVCMAKLWETTGYNLMAIAALESIKELLTSLKADTTQGEERRMYVLALTRRHLGNCYRLSGRVNEGIEEATRASNIFLLLDDGYNLACCRQNLGIAWRQVGNQARAEENFNQARTYWERQGNLNQLSITLNSLGVGLINEGRYQEALDFLLQALEKAREAGHEAGVPYVLAGLGDAYQGLRDWAKARSNYAQAGAEAGRQNNYEMRTYALLGSARTWRRDGEAHQARQAVLAALDYADQSNDRDRATAAVEYGAFQSLFSRLELALAQLEGAFNLAHKVQDLRTEAQAHLWMAYVHFQLGRYKSAGDSMRRAIGLAQELGYDAFLHEEIGELPDFAAHFQQQSVQDTLNVFFSRGQSYAADPSPKIELKAFGKGRILRGGQEVPSVSRKARELIFYLLEQRVPVSGERLSEMLWPEGHLAGNGLGSGFYSTITHARRALGGSETIRAADGAYSLNLRYRYDVELFEEHLSRAAHLAEAESRVEVLGQALALITGEFLSDGDSSWIQPRREELAQKRLRAWRLLAQTYRSQGELEQTLEVLSQMMAVEPFDEGILRDYVEVMAELKSKTVVLNFLRRKMEVLREEGIEPEEATLLLFERLDASRSTNRRRA